MAHKLFPFNAPMGTMIRPYIQKQITQGGNQKGRFIRNFVLDGKMVEEPHAIPTYLRHRDVAIDGMAGAETIGMSVGTFFTDDSYPSPNATIASVMSPRPNHPTYWSTSEPNNSHWFGMKTFEACLVTGYQVVSYNGYTPHSWRLEATLTPDIEDSWVLLHQVDDSGIWDTEYTPKEYDIPLENRGSYKAYRLVILTGNDATCRIYKLRLFTDLCAKDEILIDADPVNPLVLSFADGYDDQGNPQDIVATIDTQVKLKRADIPSINADVSSASDYECFPLYARYDTNTGDVDFVTMWGTFDAGEGQQQYFYRSALVGNGLPRCSGFNVSGGDPGNNSNATDGAFGSTYARYDDYGETVIVGRDDNQLWPLYGFIFMPYIKDSEAANACNLRYYDMDNVAHIIKTGLYDPIIPCTEVAPYCFLLSEPLLVSAVGMYHGKFSVSGRGKVYEWNVLHQPPIFDWRWQDGKFYTKNCAGFETEQKLVYLGGVSYHKPTGEMTVGLPTSYLQRSIMGMGFPAWM